MSDPSAASVWANPRFVRLYVAHGVSLLGNAIGMAGVGLLAEHLQPGTGARVFGVALTIRIAIFVFLSPLAGQLSDRIGRRRQMIITDLLRVGVAVGLFFAQHEWQLYVLVALLYLNAAFFTPVYKAVIPGVVGEKLYPKALAYNTLAYGATEILGLALGAVFVSKFGFRIGFGIDAATFLLSALLILGVRLSDPGEKKAKAETKLSFGVRRMLGAPGLRHSLLLSLQASIVGGLAIVATVTYVKSELGLADGFYPLAMAAMAVGSMFAALHFSRCGELGQGRWNRFVLPVFFALLVAVAVFKSYAVLVVAWLVSGAGQGVVGIISNNLLAQNSAEEERPHIYAAQFALSHAGWGIVYPVCGFVTASYGFAIAAWVCVGMLALTLLPMLVGRRASP